MRYINVISIIILFSLLENCAINDRRIEDEIEKKATKIANLYDSTNIEIFKVWEYSQRGEAAIWSKNVGDSFLYRCIYFDKSESIDLRVLNYDIFLKDFDVKIPYDTAYWQISFISDRHGLVSIMGTDNHGKEVLIKDKIIQDSIFGSNNPFEKFKELNDLKDSLNFIGVNYHENLGGFIQFYLSSQYILTYVPDISLLNQKYKQAWLNEFSKGKWIKKHWNLRKLDQPIDNG